MVLFVLQCHRRLVNLLHCVKPHLYVCFIYFLCFFAFLALLCNNIFHLPKSLWVFHLLFFGMKEKVVQLCLLIDWECKRVAQKSLHSVCLGITTLTRDQSWCSVSLISPELIWLCSTYSAISPVLLQTLWCTYMRILLVGAGWEAGDAGTSSSVAASRGLLC